MNLAFPSPEFDDAVASVCHGSATLEQVEALNRLLRSHPGARDEYILRLELHSQLGSNPDLFTAQAKTQADASEKLPHPGSVWIGGSTSRVLALAACVTLLVGIGWWVLQTRTGLRPATTSRAVAMLNRSADAVWQQPGRSLQAGTPLEPSRLQLQSGLVQIVLYSGARLVIEGPADLELLSTEEVVFLSGRLVAEVPPPAKGFQVRTPRMVVTDLGTEFGVQVNARETALHVFRGSVEFQSPTGAARQSLLEGGGAVAEGSSPPRLVPANRDLFTALLDLQDKSSQGEVLHHNDWRAASRRIDADPSLLVHFDFEPADLSDWRLPNSSNNKDALTHGTIVGCHWTWGRWSDKRALEFRNVSDRVRVDVPGEFDALTLAAWVRVQGMDRKINSLFMSDGFDAGTVHWSVRQDGVLALTAIGAEPREFQITTSPPVLRLDQFGLWIHLAVVVDGESKRVVHYLNGAPVSEHTLRIAPPFRIGVAELGNWNARGFPRNDPFMIRNFSGAMDDFCLFGRALTQSEIRALHSAGKPQPDPVTRGR